MLSEIDKIKTLRGELLWKFQDLEDEVAGLSTRIDKNKSEIDELRASIAAKKIEIETAKVAVEKYKSQQDNVRNNREYDFLSKKLSSKRLKLNFAKKELRNSLLIEKEKNQELANIH
jgi:uncharacterized coiled-coil DUF342 family protein